MESDFDSMLSVGSIPGGSLSRAIFFSEIMVNEAVRTAPEDIEDISPQLSTIATAGLIGYALIQRRVLFDLGYDELILSGSGEDDGFERGGYPDNSQDDYTTEAAERIWSSIIADVDLDEENPDVNDNIFPDNSSINSDIANISRYYNIMHQLDAAYERSFYNLENHRRPVEMPVEYAISFTDVYFPDEITTGEGIMPSSEAAQASCEVEGHEDVGSYDIPRHAVTLDELGIDPDKI